MGVRSSEPRGLPGRHALGGRVVLLLDPLDQFLLDDDLAVRGLDLDRVALVDDLALDLAAVAEVDDVGEGEARQQQRAIRVLIGASLVGRCDGPRVEVHQRFAQGQAAVTTLGASTRRQPRAIGFSGVVTIQEKVSRIFSGPSPEWYVSSSGFSEATSW